MGVGVSMSREILREHPDQAMVFSLQFQFRLRMEVEKARSISTGWALKFDLFQWSPPIMSLAALADVQGFCTLVPENNLSFPKCRWIFKDEGDEEQKEEKDVVCFARMLKLVRAAIL